MKDIYEVLRQKEMDLGRVRMEVESLRKVIPLLADGPRPAADSAEVEPEGPSFSDPEATGTDGAEEAGSKFWNPLRRK